MREIFSLVLMIFFLSSLSCGGQEKVPFLDFPDGLSWDFGKAREEGGELVHTYRFTNTGRDTVTVVNINTYCRCTRAAVSQKTFLPGESGEIRVGFDPYGYPGKISKSVRVTLKPEADFLLTFTAEINPRQKPVEEEYPVMLPSGLRIDRTSFNFAWMTAGDEKSMSLKCINTSAFPVRLRADVRSGSGFLDVWCPGVIPSGEKAEIVLTYRPDTTLAAVGFHSDSLELRLPGRGEAVAVDTRVAVMEIFTMDGQGGKTPGLSITNSYLNLHDIKAGSPDREIQYSVRNIGKAPLVVRDVDCPAGLSCTLAPGTTVAPGETAGFRISLKLSEYLPGKLFETVRILSNDPARPVKSLLISGRIVE